MEPWIIPIITIAAGIYFFFRNLALLRDDKKLDAYIHSPRVRLWIERYGVDKTREVTRTYLLPIGILISVMLIGIGLWGLSAALS